MAGTHNTDVDPQELEKAQTLWANFTKWTNVGVITCVVILILMAIFLL